MPLSADNFIQENTGTTSSSTDVVATLPSGTTAGSAVIVVITATGGLPLAATGFSSGGAATFIAVFYKTDVGAGETSWTFTATLAEVRVWYCVEVSGIDAVEAAEVFAANSNVAVANGGTLSTGTTVTNASTDTLSLAVFVATDASGTWSGYTNGYEEVVETSGGVRSLSVARKFLAGTTGQFECTATRAGTGTVNCSGLVLVLRAAGAAVAAPLWLFAGFEWGTHGGLGTAGVTSLMGGQLGAAGTFGTHYLIQAGSARTGSYGLRIATSAATSYVLMGQPAAGALAIGMNVRVVSATGTVVVAEIPTSSGSGIHAKLVYNASTTKYGVQWSTGSIVYESGTTPLNTWRWIDFRMRTNNTTWHIDWRIETGTDTYTDQASPTDLTGQSATVTSSALRLGDDASQTVTMDFDDVIISKYYVTYPLGPHQIRLLTVDPAGTPSVSGTSANFNVFTANGTLAAWNATNARNAVDEVPPTISASADGVAQVTLAASDYMEFPMSTYTCGPTEAIVGLRMYAPEWGGTGTGTGTLGFRGWDGTAETTLIAAGTSYDADSLTAVSATHPRWDCAMWQYLNGWTQAALDAAALRVGFSTDATPDMGVHALYLEVAIVETRTQPLFGDLASIERDPHRLGAVSITVDAPAGDDTDLYYEEGGSPTTVPVTGGTSDTEQINAVFEPDTNYIALYPPPEPDPTD